jgi:hypothetical protein
MRLDVLSGEFAIVRLDPNVNIPAWAQPEQPTEFLSITRTRDELSIVCESSQVPVELAAERGWRCLKVAGPLDFSLVGVLASLAEPLARAGIPIFSISTFDTDYLLVNAAKLEAAIAALESMGHIAGHVVREMSVMGEFERVD